MKPDLPDLEQLDVVLLGSFNPRILHPEWFLRHKLIREPEEQSANVRFISNELSDFDVLGIRVHCVSNRFSLTSDNPGRFETIQDWLLNLLNLLPHTPITALGINSSVHYQLRDLEYWHRIGDTLAPKEPIWMKLYSGPEYQRPGMKSLTLVIPRAEGFPGEINITVEPSVRYRPGLFIHSNTHHQPAQDAVTPNSARDFLTEHWKNACEEARRVARTLFQEIPNDL